MESKTKSRKDDLVQRIAELAKSSQELARKAVPLYSAEVEAIMKAQSRDSGSKRDKMVEIGVALHDIPLPKDIIVTTPEDFEWRKEIVGTIERTGVQEGKVLYARTEYGAIHAPRSRVRAHGH